SAMISKSIAGSASAGASWNPYNASTSSSAVMSASRKSRSPLPLVSADEPEKSLSSARVVRLDLSARLPRPTFDATRARPAINASWYCSSLGGSFLGTTRLSVSVITAPMRTSGLREFRHEAGCAGDAQQAVVERGDRHL